MALTPSTLLPCLAMVPDFHLPHTPGKPVLPRESQNRLEGQGRRQIRALRQLMSLVAILFASDAHAADRLWTNAIGGNFNATNNWLDGLVPDAAENAHFTNNVDYQINWTEDAAAANAFFNATSGTVTQAIGGFTWTLTNSYIIGQNFGATATVAHTSGTLRVANANGTAVLDVRRGSQQLNAGVIEVDGLLLTNVAGLFQFNGGTLITRGGTISNGSSFNLGGSSGSPAVWEVRAGVDMVLSSSLNIGSTMPGGGMLVTNGGKMFNTQAIIGSSPYTGSNSVFVTGAGSVWSNSGTLLLGVNGGYNQITVSQGGQLFNANAVVGVASSANKILVRGVGSIWSNSSTLNVGDSGSFNQLTVSNGGTVFGLTANIGASQSGDYNYVQVTGAGSVWSNTSALNVGDHGSFNQLTISNGGAVFTPVAIVGVNSFSSGNTALVTDADSIWRNSTRLIVGSNSSLNQVVITNGGAVTGSAMVIGYTATANSNAVLVTGAGSIYTNSVSGTLAVGLSGSVNQLSVRDGGKVFASFGTIGANSTANGNIAWISGAGSVWSNSAVLTVGSNGGFNRLIITNAGMVFATNLVLGANSASTNNCCVVDGGALLVTNAGGAATLEIRRGTNQLNNGLIEASRLLISGALGFFEFNCGVLNVSSATVTNTRNFFVGDANSAATLNLLGNGNYLFADGLTLRSNALLTGQGSIRGTLTVQNGGTLAPGASVGKLVLSNAPSLSGALVMDISKSSGTLTNDQVQVNGTLTYGGTLIVTNLGSDALAAGDKFFLFSATAYAGFFPTLVLPDLPDGLYWSNNLWLDGTIEVVNTPPADHFWANAAGGDYEAAVNWFDHFVPGANENANFLIPANYQVGWAADASAANALFNATGGVVTQAIGAFTWTLTNSYIIGQNPGATASVTHASGILRVTNKAETAVFDVRRGTNRLNGGTIEADFLLLTNSAGRFEFNGGTLITRGATITNGNFSVGNSGSTPAIWDARIGGDTVLSNNLIIGVTAPDCRFFVTNGGAVFNSAGTVGSNSSGNQALITGVGSVWSNRSTLNVGFSSSFNQLTVGEGGTVFNTRATLGLNSTARSNSIFVTGTGTVWKSSSVLNVGSNGGFNQLVINNGGAVSNSQATLGINLGADGNGAFVGGAGSIWSSGSPLIVGSNSSLNQLVMTNGGLVAANITSIGSGTNAGRNTVLVAGADSTLSVGNFAVGLSGSFNELAISNGGAVFNAFGDIGSDFSARSNTVLVAGIGSVWSNRNDLNVGKAGSFNRLIVADGGKVFNPLGYIGGTATANSNSALIDGLGSVWKGSSILTVGNGSSFNQLTVTNGGTLVSGTCIIGNGGASSNNTVIVTGTGSVWSNNSVLNVGFGGSYNQLVISNGGTVLNFAGVVGTASNNVVVVTGPGSVWCNTSDLIVGNGGGFNQLTVANNALVIVNGLRVGALSQSSNNLVAIQTGSLYETNAANAAALDIRRGTNQLSDGLIAADVLRLTNTLGVFEFNSGTVNVRTSIVANGQTFFVGNGSSAAHLNLVGIGVHSFADGLTLRNNGSLTGNGSVAGALTVQSGGFLAPGDSIGKVILSNAPTLSGALLLEISKSGSSLTNDQVQVTDILTYGGALIITNLGPDTLAPGDRFALFSANAFGGYFASLSLPSLGPGLMWTNRLPVDGSIQVVAFSPPKFGNVSISGTNLVLSGSGGSPGGMYYVLGTTNLSLPLTNWTHLLTNQFDWLGNFAFTTTTGPGTPQRFFSIQFP